MGSVLAKALLSWRDERGSVAILTGLFLSFLVPGVIGAVDVTNITATRIEAQSRLDAALLAASRFDDLEEADRSGEMQDRGERFVLSALRASGIDTTDAVTDFEYDEGENRMRARVEVTAPTIFVGRVLDIDRLVIEAELAPRERIELEIALSLDVSGSMGWALDTDTAAAVGARRIDVLREGVASLVSVLDADPMVDARLSVVPYSSSVNIGSLMQGMRGNGNSPARYFRDADDEPSGSRMLWATERAARSATGAFRMMRQPPGNAWGRMRLTDAGAPEASVLPLSATDDALAYVGSIEPAGWTAGHIGAEWALYSLLPDWRGVWNHPGEDPGDTDGETRKVLVVMTDGDFTVTQDPTLTIEDAYDLFQDVCRAARDRGIAVYAVGLRTSARTDGELTECTGSAENYFPVSDRTGMAGAFAEIGEQASRTRLSR